MRKGPTIIQITGFKGIFFTLFLATCLAAGFIAFPAKVAMYAWNYVAEHFISMPLINVWQGLLLWVFTALSIYTLDNKAKNPKLISLSRPMELNDEEMKVLMQRIRMQKNVEKLDSVLIKTKDIKTSSKPQQEDEENKSSSNNIN